MRRRPALHVRVRRAGSRSRRWPTTPSEDLSAIARPTDTGLTITAVMPRLGDEKDLSSMPDTFHK
jgi:hypothetical protein